MHFYKSDFQYLQHLFEREDKIHLPKQIISVPIRLNELIYFLPVDSLDVSDYDHNHVLRKSTPFIIRMYDI